MSTTPTERHKKLGQLLVERGDITGEQLIRAIQSQRSLGGRIGTCLLEMNVLNEDQLLEALSEQLHVPAAGIEQLRGISDDVLEIVPSKVALRCQAIPFFVSKTDVGIATLNVSNLSFLDELAFCTNRRVKPYIANEVRIFEALEKYYGFECPRRYGHLLDRLNRSRYMWDESAKILLGVSESEVAWSDPEEFFEDGKLMRPAASYSTHGMGPAPGAVAVPVSQPRRKAPPQKAAAAKPATEAPRQPAAAKPAPEPLRQPAAAKPAPEAPRQPAMSLADVDHLLSDQPDRELIGEVVLRFLAQTFSRCALFKIHQHRAQGWLERGRGFDHLVFRALEFKFDQPSAFVPLVEGRDFYLGPLAPVPIHRQLASSWGGEMPPDCLLVAIRIRDRLVCVLYGDRGPQGLDGLDVEPFRILAQKVAEAFELCILHKKALVS